MPRGRFWRRHADQGDQRLPLDRHNLPSGEELDHARELLAARPDSVSGGPSGLPPELEVLRDFHLPAVCLT